jgi:hypothetical protein
MIFLASVHQVNTLYEARVTVTDDDCYFATHHAFVDGIPQDLHGLPESIQAALLEEACDMSGQYDNADVEYDQMRDAV